MDLFFGSAIASAAGGLLYGLLGYTIVLLHKTTGVANFAQGALATFAAFTILRLQTELGFPLGLAIAGAFVAMALLGVVLYLLLLRPRDDSGTLNLTIRTLGVLLLLNALVEIWWSEGQPFNFPSVFSQDVAFNIGAASVSWLTLGSFLVALALVGLATWVFTSTRLGLTFLAVAENPSIAALLGIRTRRLTMAAWGLSSIVAVIVGTLVAPRLLVSSDMMDLFLLYAFAAAVVGGIDSLGGVFIGGVVVGMVNGIASVYSSSEVATLLVFALVLTTLVIRPQGLLGKPLGERF